MMSQMPPKPSKPEPTAPDATPARASIPADIAALSFEQAVEELEQIVDRIESGQIGLEESLIAAERGALLRDHLRAILARAEQRIVELSPDEPSRARRAE